MRFQSVRLPNSSYASRANTQGVRRASGAPVRRVGGLLLGGFPNDFFRVDLAHSAGPRSILLNPRYAALQKARPPARHGMPSNLKPGRNLTILLPLSSLQNGWTYPRLARITDAEMTRVVSDSLARLQKIPPAASSRNNIVGPS